MLLPSVMRRGGEVLKSGFLEGKKIKPICFYVSALGRCKVTGEQEELEELLWDITSQRTKMSVGLQCSGRNGTVLFKRMSRGWFPEAPGRLIWRKGFKKYSFATQGWCKMSYAKLQQPLFVEKQVEHHGHPTHTPFPPAAASGCATRR